MEQIEQIQTCTEPEVINLKPEFKPTEYQMEIVLENWQYLIDPDNKLTRKELCDMVDHINDPRIILMLWMINTCVAGLSDIQDQEEKEYILRESSAFIGQLQDQNLLDVLAERIITLLCVPIKLTENAGFIQIWGDILEVVTLATEQKYGIKYSTFDPTEFPFCIEV